VLAILLQCCSSLCCWISLMHVVPKY
jgi:hypothetical protein